MFKFQIHFIKPNLTFMNIYPPGHNDYNQEHYKGGKDLFNFSKSRSEKGFNVIMAIE